MKKLNLFLLAILLAGCATVSKNSAEENSTKPSPVISAEEMNKLLAPQQELKKVEEQIQANSSKKSDNKDCKIKGQKCWNVLKLFTLTAKYTTEERAAELKKMGLSIEYSTMFRDGGSMMYQLSDGTNIHVTNSIWDRSGDIKVKLSDGSTFMYDAQGNLKPKLI